MSGILVSSGALVSREFGTPLLRDIALSLSRTPRFGGHGRKWFSVAEHSLFVSLLAQRHATDVGLPIPAGRAFALTALLHDAHECLTGDVPTPFKPAAMRETQGELDTRIYNAYVPGGANVARAFLPEIHALDRRALLAEALLIGPECLKTRGDVRDYFDGEPDNAAIGALHDIQSAYPLAARQLSQGHDAPVCIDFVELALFLRGE